MKLGMGVGYSGQHVQIPIERIQLAEGNSDLLRVNIREQQTAQAASFLVDVMTEYFEARNDYRAAVGLVPASPGDA